MQLYFSPLACSVATRIALYEAGATAEFTEVDLKTKRLPDGSDFHAVNPLGQVPVLRTDDGDLLTENAAVLQYVAESYPDAHLLPPPGLLRTRVQEWLSFISTELHKGVFLPLLDDRSPSGAKEYALHKAVARLQHLDRYLAGREYLLDRFTLADAYLVAVLNWTVVTPIELSNYPNVHQYHQRLSARPSVARATAEERALYFRNQS